MSTGLRKLIGYIRCALHLGTGFRSTAAIFWQLTKNARARLRLARYHADRVLTFDTKVGTIHLRDNFGDVTNLPDLLWREVYRPAQRLANGAILDVGANIGLAARWFNARYPCQPIFCFEPIRANAELAQQNCPAAVVEAVAVGDAPGRITLQVDESDVIASSIPTNWSTRAVTFDVITLDGYTQAHGIDRIALLKIDTEGMELTVLAGAKQALQRTHQVVLETHGRERHDRVLALLEDAGFRIERETFGEHTGMVYAARPSPLPRTVTSPVSLARPVGRA